VETIATLTHWGTATRDQVHTPEIELSIDLLVDQNVKLKGFFACDGINANDYQLIRQKLSESGDSADNSDSRIRTWRKVFENIGLLYVDLESKIKLTQFGKFIRDIESQSRNKIVELLAIQAVNILKKYQLRNPANSQEDSYPEDCDIFPFWCIWKAMLSLNGKLHHEELNRVLLKVMRMDDLGAAIDRIADARKHANYDPSDWSIADQLLGERVFGQEEKDLEPGKRPQAVNRMLPWFSIAGFGGLLIESESRSDGFRYINENLRGILERATLSTPVLRTFSSKEEWFSYYGAIEVEESENIHEATYESNPLLQKAIETCNKYYRNSFIIFAGVPATGKSRLAKQVALELVQQDRERLREIQFHESYSYEDFVEGYVPTENGGFKLKPKIFRDINELALKDPNRTYVLLIEEFSRAKLTNVLGELLTYVEHRGRRFMYPLSGEESEVAENLIILGTMNPFDRSVLEMDDALIRRIRRINVPPDEEQLKTMLQGKITDTLLEELVQSFKAIKDVTPFGHGVFVDIRSEEDLYELWEQRLINLLVNPSGYKHPAYETVIANYRWRGDVKNEHSNG
jgi:hypothetical protein